MPKVFDLLITGITGYSPLHVPLKDLTTSFRAGWQTPKAPVVANSDQDISVNLQTWEMVKDLSGGAFKREFQPGQRRFYQHSPSGTGDTWTDNAVYPLAWTLRPDEPLMCGAGHHDDSGNYAFSMMKEWAGYVWAIDSKNHLVWRYDSGWKHYIGGGTGWATSLFNGNVTNATNATPIVITTNAAHGLTSGDFVQIANVGGNTAANSTNTNPFWYVTVLSSTTFSLYSDVARVTGVAGSGAYTSGGTWKATAEALNGTYPTELFARSKQLLVGTNTGIARYTEDGTTWLNFLHANGVTLQGASHFTQVGMSDEGYVLWYAGNDNPANWRVIEKREGGRVFDINDSLYPIEAMEWFKNGIFVTKRDGAYFLNPATRVAQTVVEANLRNVTLGNGRALCLHDSKIWFNMDGHLWSWDGATPSLETFSTFDGTGRKPFYYGNVIGLHSDGKQLYAWLKVTTTDATTRYMYWLCVNTGKSEWHPILMATTTIAPGTGLPTDAWEPAAVHRENLMVRYSISNDNSNNGRAKTGSLHTDGLTPMGTSPDGFTKNVAIELGWFNGGKAALQKYLRRIRYSLFDRGTNGKVRFYYKKWDDTSWTTIDTSSAGTQDNVTQEIPAETAGLEGITVDDVVNLKVELRNDDATPNEAWWLRSLYLLGQAHYEPVYAGQFVAWLPRSLGEADNSYPAGYDRATIEAALDAGIRQAQAVVLTHPVTGVEYNVKLSGVPDGDVYQVVTHEVEGDAVTKAEAVEHFITIQFDQLK